MSRFAPPVVWIVGILLFIGLIAIAIWQWANDGTVPLFVMIVVAAILGSTVNESRKDRVGAETDLNVWVYLSWKALIAVVLALFLFVVFMSELLQGPLFPKPKTGSDYVGLVAYLKEVGPEKTSDASKVILWSFVAGYSERFVPNLISQLINRAAPSEKESESDAG